MATIRLLLPLLLTLSILTILVAPPPMALAAPSETKDMLFSGESLHEGHILSHNEYTFNMLKTCNLMMFQYNRGVWSSNTDGKGHGCRAKLNHYGQIIVYDKNNTVVWSSGKKGPKGKYVLFIESHEYKDRAPDNNAVVYGPLQWSTAD